MSATLDPAAGHAEQAPTAPAPPPPESGDGGVAGGWLVAKNGRQFVRIPGVGGYGGVAWRRGQETVDETLARRLAGGGDRAPKSRKSRAGERKTAEPVAPVSRDETTRKIQAMMADLLCSPSIPLAGFGFEWEADHFAVQGDRFAANIARSSERNPWLRRYLERGLEGEQSVLAALTTLNLATGAAGYLLPPLMKWGVIPAPTGAKRAFGVPTPPSAPPPPPRPVYRPPPVVEAAENVSAMWAAAERAAQQAASPVDLSAYAAGDGSPDARVQGAEQPGAETPPPAPFADQV